MQPRHGKGKRAALATRAFVLDARLEVIVGEKSGCAHGLQLTLHDQQRTSDFDRISRLQIDRLVRRQSPVAHAGSVCAAEILDAQSRIDVQHGVPPRD